MSSAHVYLRLPEGAKFDDIPPDTLEDCAQLVKQNSIQGEPTVSYKIIYHRHISKPEHVVSIVQQQQQNVVDSLTALGLFTHALLIQP